MHLTLTFCWLAGCCVQLAGLQKKTCKPPYAGVFGSELAPAVPVLHQLIESCTSADFTALRR